MSELTYARKKAIADKWLAKTGWPSWDCLADTNSLHDCETEEEVIEAADERATIDMRE